MKVPTMLKLNAHKILISLVMTAGVAACSGGSDSGGDGAGGVGSGPASPAPVASDIPASALTSADAFVAFMNQLVDTGTNDTSEPIAVGDAAVPVIDTI